MATVADQLCPTETSSVETFHCFFAEFDGHGISRNYGLVGKPFLDLPSSLIIALVRIQVGSALADWPCRSRAKATGQIH